MKGLEPIADVSTGEWITKLLPGPPGTVTSVVPRGFAAYARVLHPVEPRPAEPDGDSAALTWAQVCRLTGRIPHALMQWAAITVPAARAGVAPSSGVWNGGEVRVGNLAPAAFGTLIDVLAPFTGEQDCFSALWEGWGWVDGSGTRGPSAGDESRAMPAPAPGVPPRVRALPRLRLPGRDYLLFRGPLQAALKMGRDASPGGFTPQSPSLLWPADQVWCVVTPIDFDSTLVGGSTDLIGAVLAAPGLETWPVDPDDDLTASADLLNSPS